MDPEMRDDLYENMADEVVWWINPSDIDSAMEKIEQHADRRTARALRTIANKYDCRIDLWFLEELDEIADRIDPDTETE